MRINQNENLYIVADFKKYVVYQLPEDDAITPKPIGGLINYTIAYVMYGYVELIKKYKYSSQPTWL
jgi:hypothetical protein